MELKTIRNLFYEIEYLERKSELLDEILHYYNKETMTFDIPEKWDSNNNLLDKYKKQTPKTPRHSLNLKISESLPYSESEYIVNWEKLDEKMI